MRIQLYTSICVAHATHMHDLSASHDFQNLTPLSLSEVGVPATSELFPATSELGPAKSGGKNWAALKSRDIFRWELAGGDGRESRAT
jgi:hypothetical protein